MSTTRPPFTRKDAILELERHGIRGAHAYLIDVLPLIEMMWADGVVQSVERDLLDKFLRQHVDNLNALVGYNAVHYDDSASFVDRFLSERPSAEMLGVLRKLIPPVRFSNSDVNRNTLQRRAIVRWCLDIGASCVTEYPYGDHDRFSEAEKACFEEIVASIGGD